MHLTIRLSILGALCATGALGFTTPRYARATSREKSTAPIDGKQASTHMPAGPTDREPLPTPSDSLGAAAAVAAFHAALARGDSAAVLALLASDVVIMEAGGVETLTEYRSHHLSGDIAYARGVPAVHTVKRVVVLGDAAWVSSTSAAEGQFNGRPVNSAGAELVVLARLASAAPWTIRAVHWSSRRRTP